MLLLAFAEFDLPSKSHHSERVCVCMCALVIEFERPVKAEGREKSRAQSADSASSRDGKKERIKERTNEKRTNG